MYIWALCWAMSKSITTALVQLLSVNIHFFLVFFVLILFTDCLVIFLTVCAIKGWPRWRKRTIKEREK